MCCGNCHHLPQVTQPIKDHSLTTSSVTLPASGWYWAIPEPVTLNCETKNPQWVLSTPTLQTKALSKPLQIQDLLLVCLFGSVVPIPRMPDGSDMLASGMWPHKPRLPQRERRDVSSPGTSYVILLSVRRRMPGVFTDKLLKHFKMESYTLDSVLVFIKFKEADHTKQIDENLIFFFNNHQ